ncbi:hypothetical protein ACTFIY_011287 [Dictyostelium cf. discoideum]
MSIIDQEKIQRERGVENVVKKTLIGFSLPFILLVFTKSASFTKSSICIGTGIGFGIGYTESFGKLLSSSSCCKDKKDCPITNNNNNNNNSDNNTTSTTPTEN